MNVLEATEAQKYAALRALKTVAIADGTFDTRERNMLSSIAGALAIEVDPDGLDAIEPTALAEAIDDAHLRERTLQALILMALADTEGTDAEAAVVERYAKAFDVDSHWVRDLRHLVEGHIMRLRLDVARSSFVPGMVKRSMAEHGWRGIIKFFGPQVGMGLDADLAWKYKRLGLLPEGTLGRTFWAHMTKNGFALPGEPQGMPEQVAPHDMIHVLTGYLTDPIGELQVGAFTAAMCRESNAFIQDPFTFLFSGMLLFHAGVAIRPMLPAAKDLWRPEPILAALQRGAATKRNLMEGWDFWHDVEKPLGVVRAELGIPEAS